jgi:carnitine O-acetyltransferase
MKTNRANDAKADFDSIYTQPTPHAYFRQLSQLDYSICDEIRPFCLAALRSVSQDRPIPRMLDIGCSYGINAAIVRHGLSFAELNRLLEINLPDREPEAAAEALRLALTFAGPGTKLQCDGLDASGPAVRFAQSAGILDHGITADLEAEGSSLPPQHRARVRDTDLLLSTGAFGYVTERTLRKLLECLPEDSATRMMFTVLRVFDANPILRTLREFGFESVFVDDTLLPQRRFRSEREQREIVDLLEQQGLDATRERRGRHFARLLIAARPADLNDYLGIMQSIAARRPTLAVPMTGGETATETEQSGDAER